MVYKQKASWNKLYDSELKGFVISAEKGNKGYWNIICESGGKRTTLSFKYADRSVKVFSRDSIFKASNSDVFYVIKYETSTHIKLELLGFN